jgi:1-acyl-sn-glycerol-3-phosphate acyltransferase
MTIPKRIKPLVDLFVTLLLWLYFTLGYFILFFPFYLYAFLFSDSREKAFQKINQRFFKSFFSLLRTLSPGLTIRIQDDVRTIRSSVMVCNHISYLDPLLLISLFEKQKTVVKRTFLKVPFLGWVVKTSGYLFSTRDETFQSLMLERVESLESFLSSEGNLFIFPEGTRSRDGRIGRLNKGAFTMAKRCRAPIEVLRITNTNTVFKPGKFLFNTWFPVTIEVKRIGRFHPDYTSDSFSIHTLMEQVRELYRK